MLTSTLQKNLIRNAFRRFGKIRPLGDAKSLCDSRCFTRGFGKITGGKLVFWFETMDRSSHIIVEGNDEAKKN